MRPWLVIDRAREPGGAVLELVRRGDEWVVRCDGKPLMSSRQHGSEEALATLALERFRERRRKRDEPIQIMIGGLGLGFTARAALDRLSPNDRVTIVEFTGAIADWNRVHLGDFARRPLEDPRVELKIEDAVAHIQQARSAYDLILLDIDNGPTAMVHETNDRLYSARGIASCFAALKPRGVLAVWSAARDEKYLQRLSNAGFESEAKTVSARKTDGGQRHTIFLSLRS